MPRQSLVTSHPADDGLDAEKLASAGSAANEIATIQREANTMARAVAAQINYQLPADCTDPDLIQRDISANMRRSVEACLEVGKALMILKLVCGHGNFAARLEVLQIEPRVAQRFMATAKRFSNATLTPLLNAAGNQTKLFEMLLLDDEQLEDLVTLGQTGELQLDDVGNMSIKELRSAVRSLRDDNTANETLLDDRAKKIDNLERKLKKGVVALTDWPAALTPLASQINHSGDKIKISLGELEQMRLQAMQTQPEPGEEASMEQARRMLARKFDEVLQAAAEQIEAIKHGFDNTLGAWVEGQDVQLDVAQDLTPATGNRHAAD